MDVFRRQATTASVRDSGRHSPARTTPSNINRLSGESQGTRAKPTARGRLLAARARLRWQCDHVAHARQSPRFELPCELRDHIEAARECRALRQGARHWGAQVETPAPTIWAGAVVTGTSARVLGVKRVTVDGPL